MRVLDLFAGIGGLSLGWAFEGHEIVAAVERDKYCAATYAVNSPGTHVFGLGNTVGDITELEPTDFADLGEIDAVIGGPPCQAFSIMGRQHREDPRALLVRDFVRIALGVEPQLIVMENVPGIRRGAGREQLDEAVAKIVAAGYCVAIWDLDAAEHGTPQRRARVFLVAARARELPPPPRSQPRVTVREALADLPSLTPASAWPLPASRYAASLGAGRHAVTGHVLTRHKPETAARLGALPIGGEDTVSGMRRLDPDGVAWTLRASSRTMTACRPVHPYEPRVITPREAARLSGFPDSFQLSDNIAQAMADIGNAVPPPLSRAVAQTLGELARNRPRSATVAADELLHPQRRTAGVTPNL